MGGEGPAVRFNPEEQSFWAKHTGLPAPNATELQDIYGRAKGFFLLKKQELLELPEYKLNKWTQTMVSGWREEPNPRDKVVSTSQPMTSPELTSLLDIRTRYSRLLQICTTPVPIPILANFEYLSQFLFNLSFISPTTKSGASCLQTAEFLTPGVRQEETMISSSKGHHLSLTCFICCK
jgi:hypothetical protein